MKRFLLQELEKQRDKARAKANAQVYMMMAKTALRHGDNRNALTYIRLGLDASMGPFMLAVRDQLHDLRRKITGEPIPA